MEALSGAYEIAKELVWTSRCAVCDKPGEILCESCRSKLMFVDQCKSCPRCGSPNSNLICTECNDVMLDANMLTRFPFAELRHVVILDEAARKVITAYKDGGEIRLGKLIAAAMASYIEPHWVSERSFLTFIPSTENAIKRRGFDQMELIADEICRLANLRKLKLFMPPQNIDQRQLTRKERLANMQRVMHVRKGIMPDMLSRPVVLIDDVCTTGATIYGAANALHEAGFSTVYGLTFGKVQN